MSRKRAAESSTAAYATAEENKRCRGAIDEMAKAAGRLDTGTEDYPQDFSHDGNPCWPRESRLVGLHSGPTSASPSVRTGQHLGRQTPYVHDALVEHRWSFLAEDDDWLIGFHRYVEKELEKSKHWTCDEEEAAWIMTWVHRLIREPGFSRLRARADRHAERGPRFSILWCAPPFPGTHSVLGSLPLASDYSTVCPCSDASTQRFSLAWLEDFLLSCAVTQLLRTDADSFLVPPPPPPLQPIQPVMQRDAPWQAAVMRDLGEASRLIATAQTAVAQSQVLAQGYSSEQRSTATKLTKQQAAVRASRENQRLRKQNAKRLEMMAASGMWMAPQPLAQRRWPPQQVIPQAVILPPGVYFMNGSSSGGGHTQGEGGLVGRWAG